MRGKKQQKLQIIDARLITQLVHFISFFNLQFYFFLLAPTSTKRPVSRNQTPRINNNKTKTVWLRKGRRKINQTDSNGMQKYLTMLFFISFRTFIRRKQGSGKRATKSHFFFFRFQVLFLFILFHFDKCDA